VSLLIFQIPANATAWTPQLSRATFDVDPRKALHLNVVLIYNQRIGQGADQVFAKVVDLVNGLNSRYRLNPKSFIKLSVGLDIIFEFHLLLSHAGYF
jgi:hypothetical protein